MNLNIPRPTWRKPPLPKSFWQKIFTGLFGALGGFLAVIPIPKNIFLRPMSYFVRTSEQKPEEKAEAKDLKQKVKELIKNDVNRQVALWSEAADEGKGTVIYKVLSSDSLWKIAKNQYGNGERWIDIWMANRVAIKEPNLIFSGQELKVPKQIIRRTALFQTPAPAPQKPAVKTAGGELIKKQIVTAARSIEQTGLETVALINQKLITAEMTGEQKTIALQVANQINGNIIDARSYARQAQAINDFNANSVDLSVRTLDLGRETIQLARAAEAVPAPAMVSNAPAMAWSQDSAGNIKYYTKQNGAWMPSEVNPIGNIGAIYGTQDITQTPEYKSGKIIKISPQPVPSAPATLPTPAPYGGAVLNTEQQAIYENLKSTRGVAAEMYKQVVLGSSPIVIAANAVVVKADTGVVALNTSIASQTIGESMSAGPAQTSSVLEKSIMAAAASARAISGSPILSETAMAEKLNNFAQASATNAEVAVAAHQTEPAVVQAVLATEAAIAANIAAPNSQAATSASEAAGRAIAVLQSTNPVEVQRVLIDIGGDGSIAPGQSSSGISSQGLGISSSDSTSQTSDSTSQTSSSFDTSVTGSTLSFQAGENTIGHITANPPSGLVGQGVANVTGSNVLGTLANLAVGVVNLFAGVANTAIGVGVNLATDQEISISPFSFATTPQQAWSGLSGTQQGFQAQRAGEIASQNAPQSGAAADAVADVGVASAVGDIGLSETATDIGNAAEAGITDAAMGGTTAPASEAQSAPVSITAIGSQSSPQSNAPANAPQVSISGIAVGINLANAASDLATGAGVASVSADTAAAGNNVHGAAAALDIAGRAAIDSGSIAVALGHTAAQAASFATDAQSAQTASAAAAAAQEAGQIAINTGNLALTLSQAPNISPAEAANMAAAAARGAEAAATASNDAINATITVANNATGTSNVGELAAAINGAMQAAQSDTSDESEISNISLNPSIDTTANTNTTVGLAPADVDTATSAEQGETGAVDDTSDVTLGVQGVVGSAYSAVAAATAEESATAAGMTSSEAGARTSAEVAAQNASNPALAGGTAIGNSMSVATASGITGTVGIMSFGAGIPSHMTVTLSNGLTFSFGMNAGTLASQNPNATKGEMNQAIALNLKSTQDALQSQMQPKLNVSDEDVDVTPQITTEDVEDMGLGQAMSDAAAAATAGTPADSPAPSGGNADGGPAGPTGPTGPGDPGNSPAGDPGGGDAGGGSSGDAGDAGDS